MEVWIGPAIVAALVSALVSAAGWFVSSWQAQRLDERRRDEKVHDFQVALRAEIASDLLNLQVGNRDEMLEGVAQALSADPQHVPFVPRLARNMVFEQVVREIAVLPGDVIAAVINYQQLRQSIEYFVDDIRATKDVAPTRRLLIMSDYFDMLDRLEVLAINAVAALGISLSVSRRAAVPPNPGSASARAWAEGEAAAERKASP